ncbi:MAG: hypothetical protein LBC77_06850 [Spirochaetaceae bacterium]|jgi:hypothetical protein|nr:hypothetical protein [Spirochaetaceae bacterium]
METVKKQYKVLAALALTILLASCGHKEYTIHYSGDFDGTVSIKKENKDRILIKYDISKSANIFSSLMIGEITRKICPILPENHGISLYSLLITSEAVIDGKSTTVKLLSDSHLEKMSLGRKSKMATRPRGQWNKIVVDSSTTVFTNTFGLWRKVVVEGGIETYTDSTGRMVKCTITKSKNDIYVFVESSGSYNADATPSGELKIPR